MAKALTREQKVERAGRLYQKRGATIRSVAETLGVSYSTAHAYVRDSGVEIKPRGPIKRSKRAA